MTDERDDQYRPWARDPGAAKPGVPASDTPSARRAVARLSADELLARPAPLPTQVADPPGMIARARGRLNKAGALARAANEAFEPARRARAVGKAAAAAGRAALAGGRRAATTLKDRAAPQVRKASDALADGLAKGGDAIASGLAKGSESAVGAINRQTENARLRLNEGTQTARTRIGEGLGKGAAAARGAIKSAIPERRAGPEPESELDRLIAREGLDPIATNPPAAPPPVAPSRGTNSSLPLFAEDAAAASAAPAPAAPAAPAPLTPPATARSMMAAINAQAPVAPPPEMLQITDDEGAEERGDGRAIMPAAAIPLATWARHPASWVLAGLALLASSFALGRLTAPSGATMGAAIDAHLLANPDIIPRAMERLQENRAAEAIAAARTELTTPFSGAWAGAASGDATLVVFTDYACTFCRASVPDIDRLLREDRNLKIVFRELPILSADSEPAARVALAAARRGQYMTVHRALFRSAQPDAAARRATLAAIPLVVSAAETANPAIRQELEDNVALARRLGIDGTPAFVVGDRLLVGAVGYDRLRNAIAEARR